MTPAQQIEALIVREGGYVDNPSDRGGPTRYGITQAVARANGYAGDMRVLPIALARSIYLKSYWTGPGFDRVAQRVPHVAGELFDTGVNMGVVAAAKFLQRALHVLTALPVVCDGVIGSGTLVVLDSYMVQRKAQDGEAVLVEMINDMQGVRYVELVEANPSQGAFIFGQIRNRVLDRSPSA